MSSFCALKKRLTLVIKVRHIWSKHPRPIHSQLPHWKIYGVRVSDHIGLLTKEYSSIQTDNLLNFGKKYKRFGIEQHIQIECEQEYKYFHKYEMGNHHC